ncbi:LOW QUALITY PROTEIN: testis-specific serine/threonine-protein kinase 6-like [Sinocyclocheilus rhinocerous]|uniref:LOW QUALITY PROTEIN: testis-specific serine/threonine-protein kinase 6-like n=1 Tax=Sinocyclocheilus rhinocerous TaxID=307959 RepID=UPI0007BABDF7|nr:PREDICTED: LOW QUALITY PROTEIN: testis-specific serine/threonine-protein kinase 6-like [Sinocyclocheilus rhinocerous]
MSVNDVLKGMGYKFIAEIGEGSFSQVKLATSQKHHCNVAIKIVDRVKAPKDFVQKFLPRELVILRRVNHNHIVQMHELIEVAGKRLCIVMEAAAKDLLQKIHEVNRIPEDQSKNLFSQMVSAINYLHQMDIVHRDLKCENILLTAEEQVKVTDFGFAHCVQDPSELSHTFCGSAAYTPPEVIMGMPYDPKKYDIWSLGVILYVMVTGLMPYDDTNLRRLIRLQRKSLVYPEGAGVQEPCRVFIRTLLQFSPSTRPTIQQVAEHPWLQMGKS